MSYQEMSENFGKKKLVFAISLHGKLGYLVEAYAVSVTKSGQFGYDFKKVNKFTVKDYFIMPTEPQTRILDVIYNYSDESLQKRFKRARTKSLSFYDTLDDIYIKNHIRPFVERTLFDVVELLVTHEISLYFKGEASERIKESSLMIHKDFTETCFHFEKLSDKTHYKLLLKQGEKDLNIFGNDAFIISHKPCLLFLNYELFRFEPDWEGKKLEPFIRKEFLVVPAQQERQFYEKFVQKSLLNHAYINEGFKVKVFSEKPVAVLKLEQHWQGKIMFALYFRYGHIATFQYGDKAASTVKFRNNGPEFYFEKLTRQFDFEKENYELLQSLGLGKSEAPYLYLKEINQSDYSPSVEDYQKQVHLYIDWINAKNKELKQFELILELEQKFYITGKTELVFETEEKNDWFDIKGTVKFGAFEIAFVQLKDNILKGNREYILPDGSIALIPLEWMSTYEDIFKYGHKKGSSLELKKYHFPLLTGFQEFGLKLPEFDKLPVKDKIEIPQMNNVKLRNYQREGYEWMIFLRENKLGGCLADDMGLGKTLQTLTLLAGIYLKGDTVNRANIQEAINSELKTGQLSLFQEEDEMENLSDRRVNCSLIVMPLSLVHNWIEEIKRFAPRLKVFQHTGSGRMQNIHAFNDYNLVLTTYGTVRNDIQKLSGYKFHYVILDESQIIKNASSKIFSAIKKLQCENRLVLTGTPVENSLTDLWSQFSFINPGMLGSLNFFKNEFVFPIEKRQDAQTAGKLQELIKPFVLRRTKRQVEQELPDLTEIIHYCEMTPGQESYYETKKSEIRNSILTDMEQRGVDKSRFVILSGLTKLRLIANHPAIVDLDYREDSGKYAEIIRNIEKLLSENHKVLIFSQFVKHLNLFRNYFAERGYSYSMLTGSVAEKERKKLIGDFQNNAGNQLFLISLRAGGVGLNLTGADYVFMLDPWWNPAVENQAINRAHRIGQDKNVFVYKFITRNTVEEKIVKLQQKKSKIAGMFINENNPLKSLSFDELKDLI